MCVKRECCEESCERACENDECEECRDNRKRKYNPQITRLAHLVKSTHTPTGNKLLLHWTITRRVREFTAGGIKILENE